MSPLLLISLSGFFITLVVIWALAPLAQRIGLVDRPDARKQHEGDIPLIGGLAIFLTLVAGSALFGAEYSTYFFINGRDALPIFLLAALLLVASGALDDYFHLGVFIRVLTEILAALIIIEGLNLRIGDLGNLFGEGNVLLAPELAYPFSVIAIFGVINAFNMLDGLDGLLASLILVTLFNFHLISATVPGFLSLFIGASLLAFLVSNLGASRLIPKSFLGDAGSKLLGFFVVCIILIAATKQVGGIKLVKPATALYIVALPLYDMVLTTLRRVIRGDSPFTADRRHIHHMLLSLGFSKRRTLLIICCGSLGFSGVGFVLNQSGASEALQMGTFVGLFVAYSGLVVLATELAQKITPNREV